MKAVKVETDGSIKLPKEMRRLFPTASELAVWSEGDMMDLKRLQPFQNNHVSCRPHRQLACCRKQPQHFFRKFYRPVRFDLERFRKFPLVEPHGLTAVAPLHTLRRAEPSEAYPPSPRLRRVPTSHSSTGLHPWLSAKEGKF